ncbi:MAG: sensor domain-containing diguanylate cyclase [Candidatus Omnitrophica bacterium]|nr:sensor domain-containing diguanylate cyclase [Candidatus Omnitrophota bacterium]
MDYWTEKKLNFFYRETDKLNFLITDLKLESSLFHSTMRMAEFFTKDIPLEETINNLADEVKKIFKDDIVSFQLFGDHFISITKGLSLQIPVEFFDEIIMGSGPFLINNISSFPKYKFLAGQGIKSFMIAPLSIKKEPIGLFGIFSGIEKQYTQRHLELLSMLLSPVSLVIENAELLEKTKILSLTDTLTQIYNRRHFQKSFKEIGTEAMKDNFPVSLAMIDIDYFKNYNDKNGHIAGDKVLKEISYIFKKHTKGSDIVARYGGEEFVIVFPNTTKENAQKICEKLRKSVEKTAFPFKEYQPNGNLTISIGIATYPQDTGNIEDILQKADEALYKAKNGGRNRVILT